ncbi:OmpA family protein [Mucilaginibacter roseus]|uniref:OmpA family protein n=1 Tax=Mucilaginibacter roseus TaxID=1528868 RepID=A0ABS8U0M2_9SPHI|nr:OmpA family protein [Mucilaginibacter roseus]MCD8739797.1 OmpA family protein [Mucilaginibacter roseus]
MKRALTKIGLFTALLFTVKVAGAQNVLKQADEQYNLYNYKKAAELYLDAYKRDSSSLHIVERLANSYRMMHDYPEAEIWYEKTVVIPESNNANIYRYAEVLKNNGKYAEAKRQFGKYYASDKVIDKTQLKFWTDACDSALKWMKNPTPVQVKNEQLLNSTYADWGARKYNDQLVFVSDRESRFTRNVTKDDEPFFKFDGAKAPDKRQYGWTGNGYLHLYESANADSGRLFPIVNNVAYHTGPASFTADGNEMYYTITRVPRNWSKDLSGIKTFRLEVYFSKKDAAGKWTKPVPFKFNNEKKYSVGDPFISADGSTLYFVSDMPGGMGATDIYYCVKDEAGNWQMPVNLQSINTAGSERTPFIDAEGNLYFSTDGLIGMGGLDVFRAFKTGDFTFAKPENLQYPTNSPRDDFSYVIYNGRTGYLSSNRLGGVGSDDIYSFNQQPELNLRLEGIVYEKGTRQPVYNAKVGLSGGAIVITNNTGYYSFSIRQNSNYNLRAEKQGYLSDNEQVSTSGLTNSQTLKKDLYLEKIVLNKAIRLENIYYDFDRWEIRPDAAIELDKLIKILQDNPTIQIELGSHTDSRGDDDYNMELSRKRANAAVDYILDKGNIDEGRIVARGYGESRLLNRCKNGVKCSDADHQLNRRTEFTIIKM